MFCCIVGKIFVVRVTISILPLVVFCSIVLMPPPEELAAASGAEIDDDERDDVESAAPGAKFDDENSAECQVLKEVVGKWEKWRIENPVRANHGQG